MFETICEYPKNQRTEQTYKQQNTLHKNTKNNEFIYKYRLYTYLMASDIYKYIYI